MLTVRFMRAGATEAEVKLDQVDVRLGRATDNDVELKDPDKTLSRHHAELRREGNRWFYLDLNSANGSWIGDQRVTRQELTPGVAITLGDYELTVVSPAAAATEAGSDLEATQIFRPSPDTARMPAAGGSPRVEAPRAAASAPPAAGQVVGGAVSVGAPPPPPAGPAPMTPIRKMIIFGAIGVFGAFAIMLALLLRPDPNAPAEETATPPAADAVPAPAPQPPTPPATPEPTAAAPVEPSPAPVAAAPAAPPPVTPAPATPPQKTTAPPVAATQTANVTKAPPKAPPKPRVVRDADPDAAAIPARAGEDPAALQQRREDIRRRYAQALQRLSAQQFVPAREALADIAGEAPKFRDVAARLVEAEVGLRQQAAEGFKAASKIEESGEWSEALRAYERLRPYGSALPALTESIERTRKRMHEAGAEALVRARQYDSRGRVPEAIAWYQRAVNWLPPDHSGLDAAKKRLAQLMNRQ